MNRTQHVLLEQRQPWVYAMMLAAGANVLSNTVGILADFAVVRLFLPQVPYDWGVVFRSKLGLIAYWLPLMVACGLFLCLSFAGEKRNPPKWSAFLIVGLQLVALGHYSLANNVPLGEMVANLIPNPLVNHNGSYCLMPRLLLTDVFWVALILFLPALLVEMRSVWVRDANDCPDSHQLKVVDFAIRTVLVGTVLSVGLTAVLANAGLAMLLAVGLGLLLALGSLLVMVLVRLWGFHASGREALVITLLSAWGTAFSGPWLFIFLGETLAQVIACICRGNFGGALLAVQAVGDPALAGVGLVIAVSLGTSVTLSSALVLRRRLERCLNLGACIAALSFAGILICWALVNK